MDVEKKSIGTGKSRESKADPSGFGYKAAVFDYDGTVVDSMRMWSTVPSRFVRRLGAEAEPGFDEMVKYMSLEESAQKFREYGAAGTDEEIIDQIMEMVMDSYRYELQLKPGILDVLEDLKAHQVRMCVASQTPSRMIQEANRRLGLEAYFETVYSCGEWNTHKREPEIYRLSADFLGALPGETLVFEDMVYAVETAADAGFAVVGVYDDSSQGSQKAIRGRCRWYLESFADWPGVEGLQDWKK